MDLKSGYPLWLIRNGLPFDYSKLDKDLKTEVVILGGGISGALTSYYLTEAGMDSVVLDSRSIGLGSTCASTSLLQYEIDTPLCELTRMIGETNARRAYRLCGESILKLQEISKKIGLKEFQLRKSVYYATRKKDEKYLKEEFDARKGSGFDVSLLNREELNKSFGFGAPGAIVSELAAEADSYRMTHLLHQYNISKGAMVFDRSKVEEVKAGKNCITLRTGNGSKIEAKKVVYATGYEVTEMLSKNIVKLKTTYATASEQFADDKQFWNERAILWNTAQPYLYMRTTNDKRIIIGGRDDDSYKPSHMDKSIRTKTKQLVADFKHVFPDIEFIPEFGWAGVFGSTKDGLPYIGSYNKYPNSYFTLGFGGNGITFSQVAAEIIRDLCMGKRNPDEKLFSFNR